MSNFNALNPIRKAEIIQRRLFGKIKDYLARNDDDKDKTITELTTDVDSSFNKILTRCKYSPLDFNEATKLSDLAENRVNIPTLTEMGGILTVKQTIHQNSSELFKIETHTGGHVIISSDSIPNTGGTQLITQHYHADENTEQIFGGKTTFTSTIDASNSLIKAKDISVVDISSDKLFVLDTNSLIAGGVNIQEAISDISINYVSKSSLSGQMDPNRFILTKSYNVPDTGPIGTWATYTSSYPTSGWNALDKGYYNLVADTDASFNDVRSYTGAASEYPGTKALETTGQPNGTGSRASIYTDSCQNSSISYVNLQFFDGSGNDYGHSSSNTTYGTTDAVLRDASGNDLIKYGDYILIERDGVGASGGYPNNYVILGPVDWILRPLFPAIQIGRNSTYPFWREGKGTLDGMIKISRLARYPEDFSTPLDFTTLTDVSSSKIVDVYNNSSQFGNHLGEFTTYTALRDISNGAICMTELSNNKVYAVMTDPSRNSLSGNAVKYLLGVALEDAASKENVRILSNGYCTVRGDFLIQVTEDASGVTQGKISLGKETNGNIYGTDVSGIIFTDSGGTTNNYTPEENLEVAFDAGINRTIDLSINELFTEHGYSSLYDRLGFQVSDDGNKWENADISGLIQTRETELLPPWPPGGTGTAKNGSVRSRDIEGHGWIFPERNEFDEPNSLFVTRMDHSGNPTESYGPTYMSQIKKSFDDNMKRYIRFYFRSDRSGDFIGWNILVKSSSGAPAFENSVVANSILYLSQGDVGKATAFTGSGIRLGYSVIDSSSNNIGDFTYARIQDTNN